MIYKEAIEKGLAEKAAYSKQINGLKKRNKKQLDEVFHKAHTATFRKLDCLKCANCCKTTSPIFRDVDIKRLSKYLRLSEQKFIDQYLFMDKESDYVLKTSPCAFLNSDNTCQVYEFRPLACREYPHTDRKNMFQILDLTRKNSEICPAVVSILDEINISLKK